MRCFTAGRTVEGVTIFFEIIEPAAESTQSSAVWGACTMFQIKILLL